MNRDSVYLQKQNIVKERLKIPGKTCLCLSWLNIIFTPPAEWVKLRYCVQLAANSIAEGFENPGQISVEYKR